MTCEVVRTEGRTPGTGAAGTGGYDGLWANTSFDEMGVHPSLAPEAQKALADSDAGGVGDTGAFWVKNPEAVDVTKASLS